MRRLSKVAMTNTKQVDKQTGVGVSNKLHIQISTFLTPQLGAPRHRPNHSIKFNEFKRNNFLAVSNSFETEVTWSLQCFRFDDCCRHDMGKFVCLCTSCRFCAKSNETLTVSNQHWINPHHTKTITCSGLGFSAQPYQIYDSSIAGNLVKIHFVNGFMTFASICGRSCTKAHKLLPLIQKLVLLDNCKSLRRNTFSLLDGYSIELSRWYIYRCAFEKLFSLVLWLVLRQ